MKGKKPISQNLALGRANGESRAELFKPIERVHPGGRKVPLLAPKAKKPAELPVLSPIGSVSDDEEALLNLLRDRPAVDVLLQPLLPPAGRVASPCWSTRTALAVTVVLSATVIAVVLALWSTQRLPSN